jgi:hypothetical protein
MVWPVPVLWLIFAVSVPAGMFDGMGVRIERLPGKKIFFKLQTFAQIVFFFAALL